MTESALHDWVSWASREGSVSFSFGPADDMTLMTMSVYEISDPQRVRVRDQRALGSSRELAPA
jgi:hypothetical protein